MATISENLQAIRNAKSDIKQAIESKGQSLDNVPFTQYAQKINAIQTGGEKDMLQAMVDDSKSLKYTFSNVSQDIVNNVLGRLDTSKVTDMSYMFFSNQFKTPNFDFTVPYINTDNVTNMSFMFATAGESTTSSNSLYEIKGFSNTSKLANMNCMFKDCQKLKAIPPLNTSGVSNMARAFMNCRAITELQELDTSNVSDIRSCFYYCSNLKQIKLLNTSKITNFNSTFNYCKALETLSTIDLIKITSSSYVSTMFDYCTNLMNLTLKNIKVALKIGSGTSWGHLLTVDSLVNTIKELWDYSSGTSTYTLTMGNANTAKLANVYVKLITPTAEQIATDPYIESKMPCEVCESTDDGAMLITDYATLKKWTLA